MKDLARENFRTRFDWRRLTAATRRDARGANPKNCAFETLRKPLKCNAFCALRQSVWHQCVMVKLSGPSVPQSVWPQCAPVCPSVPTSSKSVWHPQCIASLRQSVWNKRQAPAPVSPMSDVSTVYLGPPTCLGVVPLGRSLGGKHDDTGFPVRPRPVDGHQVGYDSRAFSGVCALFWITAWSGWFILERHPRRSRTAALEWGTWRF